jgi:hypothetical protein
MQEGMFHSNKEKNPGYKAEAWAQNWSQFELLG